MHFHIFGSLLGLQIKDVIDVENLSQNGSLITHMRKIGKNEEKKMSFSQQASS